MGYLVAKIVVLLVLAAACGFWLGCWWLSQRHRDVTDEYTRLVDAKAAGSAVTAEGFKKLEERLETLDGSIKGLRPGDVESRLGAVFGQKLSALERTILSELSTPADLAPVSQRLESVERAVARIGAPDLGPIEARLMSLTSIADRLSALERLVGGLTLQPTDFGPVTQRVEVLAAAVGDRMISFEERLGSLAPEPADLGPVTRRLEALAAVVGERMATVEQRMDSSASEPADFGPVTRRLEALAAVVNDRMAALEQRVGAATSEPADLGPVIDRLEAVERAVTGIRVADLGPIEARLSTLGAIAERLHTLSQSVERLSPAATDLSPVNRRIEALAGAMGDRLSSLESTIGSLETKPADFGQIEARLAAILDRVRALGSGAEGQAPDLGWVQERMNGLERQLEGLRDLLERVVTRPTPAVVLPGSRNLLRRPVYGEPDDLKRIRGVGAGLEKILHRLGVYYFWQVAEWDKSDVRFVDAHLEIFKGRIERDQWVEQAEGLAAEHGSAQRPDSPDAPSAPASA
jgi:predicted flap endonuclease-1-like 5' DNA nuclease